MFERVYTNDYLDIPEINYSIKRTGAYIIYPVLKY